jgi:hypothetical protein
VGVTGKVARYPDVSGASLNAYARNNPGAFPIELTAAKNYDADESKKKDITIINSGAVERVVPKFITFSDYSGGGIFIFNGWLYYGSPSVRRSKTGSTEYTMTEFYRTKLNGQNTQLLYTSEEAVKAYMFYRFNGKTYLVCHEEDTLLSLTIEDSTSRKVRKTKLADDVTDVLLPSKGVWYNGINENTLFDFVFYTRALTKSDGAVSGNALEMRRPDLQPLDYGYLEGGNATYIPAGVDGTTLFYYETLSGTSAVKRLLARDYSSLLNGAGRSTPVKKPIADASSIEQLHVFTGGGGAEAGEPYAFAVSGGALYKYQDGVLPEKITDFDGTIQFIDNNTVYYTGSDNLPYSLEVLWQSNRSARAGKKTQLSKQTVLTDNGFGMDSAGGLLFYIGSSLDQAQFAEHLADGAGSYTYVKNLLQADMESDEYFIGKLAAADITE